MVQRTFKLKTGSQNSGDVLYWMSREQRDRDNWTLINAYNDSIERKSNLYVVFALTDNFHGVSKRQFPFMFNGLNAVSLNLQKLNIHFQFLTGNPPEEIAEFVNQKNIAVVYTDFDPLRIKRQWKKELAEKIDAAIFEVDSHNIVPCRIASDKQEFGAYTIRNKIKSRLVEYLTEFPDLEIHPFNENVNNIFPELDLSNSQTYPAESKLFISGMAEAHNNLKYFLENRLNDYALLRNDPSNNFQSNLSPYLHFGQISAQRIALEVINYDCKTESKDAFLEELIIRKELSDNFCFYNQNYDNFEGFPDWAKKTLSEHQADEREHIYNTAQFENAQTHDPYWNAAKLEMVGTGKMHGYMRMYWAKKILEWTETPESALETAIYLNDKYELDGGDPNGYAGIAWSIGGVHDRAWGERPVFGKIRYMNDKGLKRKFNIDEYVRNINRLMIG